MSIRDIEGYISIYRSKDFITIAPIAISTKIYDLENWYPIDISELEIGRIALEAFDESRRYILARLDNDIVMQTNHDEWVEATKKKFGYKTNRAMYSKMSNCSACRKQGKINITVGVHKKLRLWFGILETYIIEDTNDPNVLGHHLRVAMERGFSVE